VVAATAAAPGAVAAVPTADIAQVTVRPDPTYQGDPFEGWGTSLVWFANATGDYPDEIREQLAEMVFGEDGLNLNIARYNIGGGNAPDVPDYLRLGGAVEGWWRAPEGTTRTDTDWWDPDNPDHWNWDADQTQRWWIDAIKDDITHWEAFSNSPPWFQTVSGYVTGGFNGSTDQLKTESIDDFTTYLVRVVEYLEDAHGIEIDTLDPFNEPNTSYWSTRLGADGEPVGGRQEGAHMGPALQQQVIRSLAARLAEADTDAVISAMDETNPGTFLTNWNSYPDDVRAMVDQLNVHTYGTGQRTAVRDVAKGEDKPLWMSEVEGSWGNGQDFESMVPGLGMADRIVDDLRELEPTAWVFWQPVEDYDNMKPGGESALGANWGSIQIPFNCTAEDTLATCPIYTNTKFDTVRNFTHYIRPGDRLVAVNDPSSVAAVSETGASVVHINDTGEARAVTLDLSAFGTVHPHATVTPVVTSADGALVEGAPVRVQDRTATLQVPAESVTTFVIDGARGAAADAALVQDGHVYRIQGAQSGKSLTATETGTVIATTDPADIAQLWSLRQMIGGTSNRSQYAVSTVDGRQLAVVDGELTLTAAQEDPDTSARWILSTTGDGTYTFVNVATRRLIEVGGQATADGSPVSTWLANSGSNQRWAVADETVLGIQTTEAFTLPGVAPELPSTVVPQYRDGARGSLPVTWQIPPDARWERAGTVTVIGEATDALGTTYRAEVVVTVDTLVSTLPARAKTFVGGTPELPATVTAVGSQGGTVERPATWDVEGVTYDAVGTVTVPGLAQIGDGSTLPATLRVQVTEPVETNAALAEGTTVAATFTEPGYSTSGLVNGTLTDKAWSNWKPGTKNLSDTITVNLPQPRMVSRVATHFYRDGSDSYAQSIQVQVRTADGQWADAGGPVTVPTGTPTAPVVDVVIPATLTDAIRVVLTARPATHMTISEIQVMAHGPGVSSDATAASIALDGTPLAEFDPQISTYTVDGWGRLPTVEVLPSDPYAEVVVDQASQNDRSVVVTLTSEDGSQSRTYTVSFPR